jgi:hypothetical protein
MDPDPVAGVDELDRRPGHLMVAERVHDLHAGLVHDHPRAQREDVREPGDQQQDRADYQRAVRQRSLHGQVDDIGQRERQPQPPHHHRRAEPEDLTSTGHVR